MPCMACKATGGTHTKSRDNMHCGMACMPKPMMGSVVLPCTIRLRLLIGHDMPAAGTAGTAQSQQSQPRAKVQQPKNAVLNSVQNSWLSRAAMLQQSIFSLASLPASVMHQGGDFRCSRGHTDALRSQHYLTPSLTVCLAVGAAPFVPDTTRPQAVLFTIACMLA